MPKEPRDLLLDAGAGILSPTQEIEHSPYREVQTQFWSSDSAFATLVIVLSHYHIEKMERALWPSAGSRGELK